MKTELSDTHVVRLFQMEDDGDLPKASAEGLFSKNNG